MNTRTREDLLAEAKRLGYTVTFRPIAVDERFGDDFTGSVAAFCDPERKEIVIGTYMRTEKQIAAILAHELEHANGSLHAHDVPEVGLKCGGVYRGRMLAVDADDALLVRLMDATADHASTREGVTFVSLSDVTEAVARHRELVAEVEALRGEVRHRNERLMQFAGIAAERDALREEVGRLQARLPDIPRVERQCKTLDDWRYRAIFLESEWSGCSSHLQKVADQRDALRAKLLSAPEPKKVLARGRMPMPSAEVEVYADNDYARWHAANVVPLKEKV